MTAQDMDDDILLEDPITTPEYTSKATSATRLERRRRIEELNEERRLKEELGEF